jgi:hypothetical protein
MAFKKQICLIVAASFSVVASLLCPVAHAADLTGIDIPELKSVHEDSKLFGAARDEPFSEDDASDNRASYDDAITVARETPEAATSGALIPMPSAFGLGAAGLIVAALISRKFKLRIA